MRANSPLSDDSSPARQYLASLINHEQRLHQIDSRTFRLERMRGLVEALDISFQGCPVVHIAGTKGKGSTSMMLASILRAAGKRVGLYTSPHMDDLRERVRILSPATMSEDALLDGMISVNDLEQAVTAVRPVVERQSADVARWGAFTFFEVFTAAALWHFSSQPLDVLILETGLGGRLDATNVIPSMVAVLTPVSLEHTHLLGSTLAGIAQEKVQIVKTPGQAVVVGVQPPEVRPVIAEHCRRLAIPPVWTSDYYKVEDCRMDARGQMFTVHGPTISYPDLWLSLLGAHQIDNALMALAVTEELLEDPLQKEHAVRKGLGAVRWPGRCELVPSVPVCLLDGAHNEASLRALQETVAAIFPGRNVTCVLGVSQDKDVQAIVALMAEQSETLILTRADHPRAAHIVRNDFTGLSDVTVVNIETVDEAMRVAFERTGTDDVIVVTGSLFVMSEARRWLKMKKYIQEQKSC